MAEPVLIAPLIRFQDQALNPIPVVDPAAKKSLIPGWLASALILATVLTAGVNGMFYMTRHDSDDKPAAVETPPAPRTASPVSKTIEVTGFRIQMDPGKKSEIRYLVVNHTANRFANLTVYVTLYAVNAPAGQPPLARFQFAAPDLNAFESKEMTSAIERVTRPVSLPDWQDLRADIGIGQ